MVQSKTNELITWICDFYHTVNLFWLNWIFICDELQAKSLDVSGLVNDHIGTNFFIVEVKNYTLVPKLYLIYFFLDITDDKDQS